MEFTNITWLPTFGWWAINILIPVIGPVFFLWIFGFPRSTAPLASNNVIKSIGKGELLWAVMGMAAATCSDLVALQGIPTVTAGKDFIWLAFGLHLFLIVISVVAVGLNSLNLPAGYTPANVHIPDNRIFVMSIAALVLVSVTYSATHATLTDQEEAYEKSKIEALKKTVSDKQAIIDSIEKCLSNAKSGGKNCLKGIK
ncbi:hypothetical protein [Janthinobacterium sp.]|uniref:hypothetical protein n=1 Tax=Janthinobacterium sp. TaxID=1871054 RepID=UPI0026344206|nr:hypothetical protein [Janthinobacterium sp.]